MAHNPSNDNGGDERNPFVAFRHFADEHIGAAVNALSEANADIWKRLEDAEGDARKAWKRFNDSYERATSPERRQTERDLTEKERPPLPKPTVQRKQQEDWPSERHNRDLAWSGWGAEHWPAMRFGFDRFFDRPGPWRPSLEFLAKNRYSPLVLEQRYPTEQEGTKWRHAFEDLLNTENGGNPPDTRLINSDTRSEPPEDWLRRLVSKEMISLRRDPWFWMEEPKGPLGWPNGHGRDIHTSPWHAPRLERQGVDEVKGADTELDLYEHFLGDRSTTPAHGQTSTETEFLDTEALAGTKEKPSVVATMTTTERRMLPDGTVTTKTVLKKRFSDGTEEQQETSDTTVSGSTLCEQPILQVPDAKDQGVAKEAVKPLSKKNNWFWSG